MPIYEFRCEQCHAAFERLTPFGAAPPACPDCGASNAGRTISRFVAGPASRRPRTDFSSVPFTGPGACGCSHHHG